MLMFFTRPALNKDLKEMYQICHAMANTSLPRGEQFEDANVLGDLYIGPYFTFEPSFSYIVEDHQGLCGYIVGTLHSAAFYRRLTEDWLPQVRNRYPDPAGEPEDWSPTQTLYHGIHHPEFHLPDLLADYPSHWHVALLPRAQKKGLGSRLMSFFMERLKEAGSEGVHLSLNPDNTRAQKVFEKLGFKLVETVQSDLWITRYLGRTL